MRCLALLLVLWSTPLPLRASETRMDTLRNPSGLRDVTDIYDYPGTLTDYSLALVELGTLDASGTSTDVYGGAVVRAGRNSFGAVFSRDESLLTDVSASQISLVDDWLAKSSSNTNANGILPAPERPLDLFYGARIGGKNALGVRITFADFKDKSKNREGETNKSDAKAEQLDLHLGYSIGGASRFDIGLDIGLLGSLKRNVETATTTSKNRFKRGTTIGLLFRLIKHSAAGNPYFEVRAASRSPEVSTDDGTTSEEVKFDEKVFVLGGGYIVKPKKRIALSTGVNLVYLTSKGPKINDNTGIQTGSTTAAVPSILASDEKIKRTTTALQTLISLETPIWNDLGFLGGLSYILWGTIKEEDNIAADEPEKETSLGETPDDSLWSLGMFYKLDRLRADASLSKPFLHRTPHLISGAATNPLLAQISVSYKI